MAAVWHVAISDYLTYLRAVGRRPETVGMRRYWLTRMSIELPPLPAVTHELIVDWMAGQDWGPNTRRSARTTAVGFFRWAVATRRLRRDPTAGLPPVRCPAGSARPVSEDVLLAALNAADRRTKAALLLGSRMGLRRGEVARARVEDIHGDQLWVRGKGGKNAHVPLHPDLLPLLPESGPIVPNARTGEHVTPAYVGVLVRRAMRGQASSHQLRHRFACVAYERTLDLRNLQSVLRHESLATTQQYVQTDRAGRRAVVLAV